MGKNDVLKFLNSNIGNFFTANDISRALNISLATISSNLRKLHDDNAIYCKRMLKESSESKKSYITKVYSYKLTDKYLDKAINEFNILRAEKAFEMVHSDTLLSLLIIKELKELKEVIKNGRSNE